jgi:rhodanese-related sulfurtransferase
MLVDRGLTDVRYLTGGFEAWRRAGYPLELK